MLGGPATPLLGGYDGYCEVGAAGMAWSGLDRQGTAVLGRVRRGRLGMDGGDLVPPSISTRQEQYVCGECNNYWTPSLELADKALSTIAAALKRTDDDVRQARLRRDLDAVLERRMILELEWALKRKR